MTSSFDATNFREGGIVAMEARKKAVGVQSSHLEEGQDGGVVKSARRVLQILEYFNEIRRPASATEISRKLSYPLSSTAALLKSLAALSYLHYDRYTRDYVPTIRISLLGSWINEAAYPVEELKTLMAELRKETRLSVVLSIRNGIHAIYLQALQGDTPIRYHLPSKESRLLTRSVIGRVMMSALPDEEIDLIIRRCNATDKQGVVSAKEIKGAVQKIRRQRYVYTRDLPTRGASVIAMLLPGAETAPLLTVAIAGPNEYLDKRQKALVKTMRDIIARHALKDSAGFGADNLVMHES